MDLPGWIKARELAANLILVPVPGFATVTVMGSGGGGGGATSSASNGMPGGAPP